MADPTSTTDRSIMPRYPWLLTEATEFSEIQPRVDAMVMLGVPYGDAVNHAEPMARAQAEQIAAEIVKQGGPEDLADKKIVALTAYLQRLGTDIKKADAQASEAARTSASLAPRLQGTKGGER